MFRNCTIPGDVKCRDNGICIHSDMICNGISDCMDGSDEENCSKGKFTETLHVSIIHNYISYILCLAVIHMYVIMHVIYYAAAYHIVQKFNSGEI